MNLSTVASTCSEITVILAALAMLIKPIRNKLLGLDKLTDALKCQLRHDMLHTYYRHREGRTIRQYELEDFLYLPRLQGPWGKQLYRPHQVGDRRVGGDKLMDWAETILAGVCVVCMTLLGVDLYKSAREKLKTMRKRDKYVWAAIFNLTWYCISVLVLSGFGKIVPDSLTVMWGAAWTAELALLAGIKIKGKDD